MISVLGWLSPSRMKWKAAKPAIPRYERIYPHFSRRRAWHRLGLATIDHFIMRVARF